MPLYLEGEELLRVAREHRSEYATAAPFPHVVLDGLLPEEMLDTAIAAFPDPSSDVWKRYDNYHEVKLETQGEELLDPDLSLMLYQFNSAPFLQFLEELTGITGLIPDPYFSGGGLHQIPRGGRLGIHADFSRHRHLALHRRLNVLVYLNRGWEDHYGGHLELWNHDATECCARIGPVYNRVVVFTITDWAFHGHPDPLACPPDMTRKSIALYYYTAERPEGETIPDKDSTLFVLQPGEVLPAGVTLTRDAAYTGLAEEPPPGPSRRQRIKHHVRRATPPFLYDAAARARQRLR